MPPGDGFSGIFYPCVRDRVNILFNREATRRFAPTVRRQFFRAIKRLPKLLGCLIFDQHRSRYPRVETFWPLRVGGVLGPAQVGPAQVGPPQHGST